MPMRQLRTCEFCGADAAGVYEVLPPELSPTEAEQRRIVLCGDCAGTLESVIDPLLERLGVDATDDASAVDADGGADGSSAATASSAADGPPESHGEGTGADASGTRADATQPDDPDAEPVQWDDAGRPPSEPGRDGVHGVDAGNDVEPPVAGAGADAAAGGAAVDDDGAADDADTIAGDGTDESSVDGTRGVTTDDADTVSAGSTDDVTTEGADDAATADDGAAGSDVPDSPGEEPEEFRTVMRLLGNREFPVERGAIVELAASAYDLDEGHVHRIIDHAVDRGVIVDDGGTLRRN